MITYSNFQFCLFIFVPFKNCHAFLVILHLCTYFTYFFLYIFPVYLKIVMKVILNCVCIFQHLGHIMTVLYWLFFSWLLFTFPCFSSWLVIFYCIPKHYKWYILEVALYFFLCFSTFLKHWWKLNFILAGCKLLVNLYTPLCFSEGLVLGFIIVVS